MASLHGRLRQVDLCFSMDACVSVINIIVATHTQTHGIRPACMYACVRFEGLRGLKHVSDSGFCFSLFLLVMTQAR